MSDHESISALVAADPAQGQATDLAALRRAVDSRLSQDRPAEVAPASPRDELAERRARRSRRMSWVAGAAASMIVGVSGYLVGVAGTGAGGGGGDSAGGAAEDAEPFVASEEALSGADDSGAVTDQSAGSDGAEADSMDGGSEGQSAEGGRVAFEASGLSNERTSAEAFAYDATGVATEARVQQIAEAIGLDGTAMQEPDAWSVTDAEGRRVAIVLDGTATFSYSDPTIVPGDEQPDDPVAVASGFLESIGVDVGQVVLQIDFEDPGVVGVSGYPVGASAAGVASWYVTVTSSGVDGASGWLAPLVSIGGYDVISPVEAVERLADPRFGALATELPPSSEPAAGSSTWAPTEGGTIPWALTTHTITGAELTLASTPVSGTSSALLPAWELTSDDGGTWLVPAVTDEFLDFGASWN